MTYHRMRLADAMEFISQKDYTDNWQSEMHERFCFFSFSDWQEAIRQAGFEIDPGSYAFRNEWVHANRMSRKVALFEEGTHGLVPLPVPDTNLVLVGRKPA